MYRRFNKLGEMIFPSKKEKQKVVEDKPFVIDKCYCVNGHNLIDENHFVNDIPGIRLNYHSMHERGEVVLSAIIGDFDKKVLLGNWKEGNKIIMTCPECNEKLKVLTACDCQNDAEFIAIGLTPKLNFNNSIAICNIIGCKNSHSMLKSEELIHQAQSSAL